VPLTSRAPTCRVGFVSAMRDCRAAATAAAVVMSSLCASAPAVAAPGFAAPLHPSSLSTAGLQSRDPVAALDAAGNAVVVWDSYDGTHRSIFSSLHGPGGTWQTPPVVISTPGTEVNTPALAVTSAGEAIATWEVSGPEPEQGSIQAAVLPPGASAWQAPVTISPVGPKHAAFDVRIAADGHGGAIALWTSQEAGETGVESAFLPVGSTSWQSPTVVPALVGAPQNAVVAMDPAGNAVAAWDGKEAGHQVIAVANRPAATGVWGKAQVLSSTTEESIEPQVAADGTGRAIVVWEAQAKAVSLVRASIGSAVTGGWSAAKQLSEGGERNQKPSLAMNAHGDGLAVWQSLDEAEEHGSIQSAAIAPGGGFQPDVRVSPEGEAGFEPQAVLDPQGNAVATWQSTPEALSGVRGASRPSGSVGWQPPTALSETGTTNFGVQLGVDPAGDVVAAWERQDTVSSSTVQAAAFDATGPALNSLSIPLTAVAGVPLALSVSPLDAWSALAGAGWTFGDGSSAPGVSVTHVYARPGRFSVSVTASDVLGNATATSAAIRVVAPPPPSITSASLSHARFRVGRKPTALSAARTPFGTEFRFMLSSAAKLQIKITRSVAGVRRGRSCVAPRAGLRHGRRCTRTITLGVLTRAARAKGAGAVAFSGRLGSRALAPGSYRAVLVASNIGGRSTPRTLRFTVLR
jgi:hypothetical protein